MTDDSPALALAEFRREVLVALAEMHGEIRLILQRGEQADRRADEFAGQLARLDERLDSVERTHVTREELAERSRRTVAVLGLVVALVSIAASTLTAVIIAIVN